MKNFTLIAVVLLVAAVSGLMGTLMSAFLSALAPFAAVVGITLLAAGINAFAKHCKRNRRLQAIADYEVSL